MRKFVFNDTHFLDSINLSEFRKNNFAIISKRYGESVLNCKSAKTYLHRIHGFVVDLQEDIFLIHHPQGT
ncbi:hypothetical protein ACIPUP_22515 [Pectobacterium actinidiae]|uniref:Uncharacterized protein n=1 Tax=Pectobacterium actinidiae TaxID=1507808 RepID=A0ABW8GHB1_9GAMM